MQTAKKVIVVGAGPAGLMAAEVIRAAGHDVDVYDAKPTACRKFLLAGIGGLNITHSEPYAEFIQRYYEKSAWMEESIHSFNADHLRQWVHNLGIETFVGTSGRVFPKEMKAAPLLRSWLKRLREAGVHFHMKHKLVALDERHLTFEQDTQQIEATADAIVLAMGGASWSKLGSDGAWQEILKGAGVVTHPLQSANCGFLATWSEHLRTRHAGSPLKNIGLSVTTLQGQSIYQRGECILSSYGMEGSLIYAFSKHIRDSINHSGHAHLFLDLIPDISEDKLQEKLNRKKEKESFSKYLKRTTGLSGAKAALLYEYSDQLSSLSGEQLALLIKKLPISFHATRPIEEAISSAGGVCESSVNDDLMIKCLDGVFCAGEMLDWEAPTGGYLLTACFATGRKAGMGVNSYLNMP